MFAQHDKVTGKGNYTWYAFRFTYKQQTLHETGLRRVSRFHIQLEGHAIHDVILLPPVRCHAWGETRCRAQRRQHPTTWCYLEST